MAFEFANEETTRIDLGTDDWIEVRKRLGTLRAERLRTAAIMGVANTFAAGESGGRAEFNLEQGLMKIDVGAQRMALVEAYLVAWSNGRPVSRKNIEALLPRDFERLHEAIDRHHAGNEDEKKVSASTEVRAAS